MVERVIVVHSDRGHAVDGIRDHSGRLAAELARHGLQVSELGVPTRAAPGGRRGGSLAIWRALRGRDESTAVILAYSPFCYGRYGFAPWLPGYVLAAGLNGGPIVVLLVHEPYVPMINLRWTVMGLWQRLQLAALRIGSDLVLASIEPWARHLAARRPRRQTEHLPVGSNFPDARSRRGSQRRRIGVAADTILVSCLGRDHQSWLAEDVVAAVNTIAAEGTRTELALLGAYAPALGGLDPAVVVHAPGLLDAESFAAWLAASDLFLAPLIDGVSTRRGSLMAALQHGLPVVGTEGHLTDPALRDAGGALRLTPVGDRGRFALAAAALAADPAARAVAAGEARALYEREFDWPVIVDRLLASLPER